MHFRAEVARNIGLHLLGIFCSGNYYNIKVEGSRVCNTNDWFSTKRFTWSCICF